MSTANTVNAPIEQVGRLNNIEFLRCFAIISVVVLHTLCAYSGWQSYLPELFEAEGDAVYRRVYTFIESALIPNGNMPLFTAISGYVYYYLHIRLQKYGDSKTFFKNKAKRLKDVYMILAVMAGVVLAWIFRGALPFNMGSLVYCYLYTLFFFLIVPLNIKNNSFVRIISGYSFGIYIFHEWFLWNMAHISYFQYFIINYQLLYPLVAFVAVFGISTLLTHLSLKTKVGKLLLG